jgi:hypothetical protein
MHARGSLLALWQCPRDDGGVCLSPYLSKHWPLSTPPDMCLSTTTAMQRRAFPRVSGMTLCQRVRL